MEAAVRILTTYHVELVPGLLQTADYARAVIKAGHPEESDADLDRRVQVRMQRQILITRKARPATMEVVIHEMVLRRMIGDRQIMAAQLRHLADIATRANVTLRILPFAAGIPGGMVTGSFIILNFGTNAKGKPVEPTVVYVPGFTGDIYLEKPDDVRRYDKAYEALQAAALDAIASKDLLWRVAREYESAR